MAEPVAAADTGGLAITLFIGCPRSGLVRYLVCSRTLLVAL
jgi:hypothetical protein